MKKAYLLAYGGALTTRDKVKEILDSIPEIVTWRADMPYSFYLVSEEIAESLVDKIHAKAPPNARFIVTELAGNTQGWLVPDTWFLINNKTIKPKS